MLLQGGFVGPSMIFRRSGQLKSNESAMVLDRAISEPRDRDGDGDGDGDGHYPQWKSNPNNAISCDGFMRSHRGICATQAPKSRNDVAFCFEFDEWFSKNDSKNVTVIYCFSISLRMDLSVVETRAVAFPPQKRHNVVVNDTEKLLEHFMSAGCAQFNPGLV